MSHRAAVNPSALSWRIDRSTYCRAARELDGATRVPVVATLTVDDPWLAYRCAREEGWGVCFETGGGRPGWNAFGVDPSATLTVWADDLGERWPSSLAALEATIETDRLYPTDWAPPIPGGWFGWISYDVARELEHLPETTIRDRALPRLQFARFDTIASWSSPVEDASVVLTLSSTPRVEGDPGVAYDRGRRQIEALVDRIATGDPGVAWGDADEPLHFTPGCDRNTYRERVRAIKAYIRDGETFQVNLSQRFDAPATRHPVDAYDALRVANPAPYAGLFEGPDIDLMSTSPELLLERDGTTVRTEPIAGTRPRGADETTDAALAEELRTDPKERAEHAMLVDLERNDLGKVCVPGSVEVAEYRRVDRYASVWHLVSDVRGELADGVGIAEMIAAVLPGGTITGAPKPRTMEIIDEMEDRRRGPYTGSMAVIGFDGRIRANMIIRTLEHHEGSYRLRVGGGVVHDSDPSAEYDETLAKAAAMRSALEGVDDR